MYTLAKERGLEEGYFSPPFPSKKTPTTKVTVIVSDDPIVIVNAFAKVFLLPELTRRKHYDLLTITDILEVQMLMVKYSTLSICVSKMELKAAHHAITHMALRENINIEYMIVDKSEALDRRHQLQFNK